MEKVSAENLLRKAIAKNERKTITVYDLPHFFNYFKDLSSVLRFMEKNEMSEFKLNDFRNEYNKADRQTQSKWVYNADAHDFKHMYEFKDSLLETLGSYKLTYEDFKLLVSDQFVKFKLRDEKLSVYEHKYGFNKLDDCVIKDLPNSEYLLTYGLIQMFADTKHVADSYYFQDLLKLANVAGFVDCESVEVSDAGTTTDL